MRKDESRMKDRIKSYVEWMKEHSSFYTHHSSFKYAVDCSNGMSSILVHELFPDAIVINDTLDGTFPNHSPNPLKAEAREQIAALVREQKLDCGVIFDGDADRCMFVDEKGDFVQPDYLIPIVARATLSTSQPLDLSTSQPLKIIHDVRTSRGAIEELRRMGCEPVMVPVGHAFAKPTLRKVGAVCGGELAGHYYFSEFFGCDSGVLAALRILGEVAKAKAEGKTFSEMMRPARSMESVIFATLTASLIGWFCGRTRRQSRNSPSSSRQTSVASPMVKRICLEPR